MTDTTNETFVCPRRFDLEVSLGGTLPDLSQVPPERRTDHWRTGGSFANAPAIVKGVTLRTCSYCGCLDPEIFLFLIEQGCVVGPTDKNYKLYLGQHYTEEELAERKARFLAGDFARTLREQAGDAAVEAHWEKDRADLYSSKQDLGKFYTQHFSPDQADRFRARWKEGKIAWGYPGGPYAKLYLPPSRSDAGYATDPNDPRLKNQPNDRLQQAYLILPQEERDKGFVRPVRRAYTHVGAPPNTYPLRDLTDEERTRYADAGYVKFEPYPESERPRMGRFWTQANLDTAGKGCGVTTTMSLPLAETYARDPKFYGGTWCSGCGTHLPVAEFVWAAGQPGEGERVGT